MGLRVTGVRVTPISGFFVGRGSTRCPPPDGTGADDGGGGGGGGGGGNGLRVVVTAALGVVVDGVVDVSCIGTSGAPSNVSSTTETTRATTAAVTAAMATIAERVRYQGGGGGLKCHVVALNASNGRRWSAESGAGYPQPSPYAMGAYSR